jgi:transposase-like protein
MRRDPDSTHPPPTHCPFCRSKTVVSTGGKSITASSYWRCEACGQVWHPDRLGPVAVRRDTR